MATGDVVGNVYATDTTFQPAAGVQIVITQWLVQGSGAKLEGLGDYDTAANRFQYGTGAGSANNAMQAWQNNKQATFITNDKYFKFVMTAGSYGGFTGIQIT
tara:strand:- start:733 stop:1038 length:306 start_codon:yes stop_codon:yes gene_type:complete